MSPCNVVRFDETRKDDIHALQLISEEHRSILMTTNLQVDEQFPDIELPNHQNELTRLSQFT